MAINPVTLKLLRDRNSLSQQDLADRTQEIKGGAVSKRQISRIETGQTRPDKVRRHTVESLAKALNTTVETLTQPLKDDVEGEATLREVGYRRIKVWLDPETRLNFGLVTRHYGVEVNDLIDAAPWMFTLLAEASLAERRRRLEEANAAFEEAMERLPAHLAHGAAARTDFDEAYANEIDSISARDIFGTKLLEDAPEIGPDPFDPNVTNPFLEFLLRMAQGVGSEEIDVEYCEHFGGRLPRWRVFETWLNKLTNGEWWARHAIEHGHARVDDIPEELRADDRGADRAAWLASKVPAEERDRLKQRSVQVEL